MDIYVVVLGLNGTINNFSVIAHRQLSYYTVLCRASTFTRCERKRFVFMQ